MGESSAAEGLDGVAASSLTNADEYASSADASYGAAADSENAVASDLQATEASVASVDTSSTD